MGGPAFQPGLVVRPFVLGPFETNCYVVSATGSSDCWVVDCGFDPGELIDHIRRQKLRPAALLLTHAHADHIAGIDELRRAFPGIPIHIHPAEREFLRDPELNLSAALGYGITAPAADQALCDGQTLELGGSRWTVLHTPGHSPGGVTLHCAEAGIALVGDTLFAGSIGRSDLPTSDEAALHRSIRERLYVLPDATAVYPGHGPATTIGREKRTNPFVRP